jgi:hypothetical protein
MLAQNFHYFLDTETVQGVVGVAAVEVEPSILTPLQEVLAVIYYADHDAFIRELPNF